MPRRLSPLAALLWLVAVPALGVDQGPAAQPASAPPAESPAAVAMCSGRTGPARKGCTDFCTSWPANQACLLIRTWGMAGGNAWITAAKLKIPLADSCKRNNVPADVRDKMAIWFDSNSMLPLGWPQSGALNSDVQAKAPAAWRTLMQALMAHQKGDLAAAIKLTQAARVDFVAKLGPDHRIIGVASSNLATAMLAAKRYKEGLIAANEAVDVLGRALPANHGTTANALWTRGLLEDSLGKTKEALRTLSLAIDIADASYTAEHEKTAEMRITRSRLHHDLGDYKAALVDARAALGVANVLLGPGSGKTGTAWQRVASACGGLDDHKCAVQAGEQALRVAAKLYPADHGNVVVATHNLAVAHAGAGNAAQARKLFERSIAVLERTDGPAKLNLATSEHLYGRLLRDAGQVTAALKLFRRAYDRRVAALGPLHDDTIKIANDLASLQMRYGMFKDAKIVRAFMLQRFMKQRGANDPTTARAAVNYAQVLAKTGEFAAAIKLARAALPVLRADRRLHVVVLLELARWLLATDDSKAASSNYLAAHKLIEGGALDGAGDELSVRVGLVQGLMVCSHTSEAAQQSVRIDALVRGQLLRGVDVAPNDLSLFYTVQNLGDARSLMLEQAFTGRRDPLDAVLLWQGMSVSAERLWRDRKRDGAAATRTQPTRASVCAALDATSSSLVAYVRWASLKRVAGTGKIDFDDHYSAVVVGKGCRVRPVPLGDADEIDAAIKGWRDTIAAATTCMSKRRRATFCRAAFAAMDTAGAALRKRVWDPVQAHVGKVGRVWISPDAELTRVAFDALPDPNGRYLVQDRELAVLPYPAAAVRAKAGGPTATRLAFVGGDLDYDRAATDGDAALAAWSRCVAGSCARSAEKKAIALAELAPTTVRGAAVCGRRAAWQRLPTTEAAAVAGHLSQTGAGAVILATGPAVIEPALRVALPGSRIIHLATHGFFSPFKQCVDILGRKDEVLADIKKGSAADAIAAKIVDPLSLSAVVLSGANDRPAGGPLSDGMLSGREVARMDLRGTELVVLSACETGLGEQEAGEGSIGLGRSFLLAGAEHVITSLWQVPSEQTAALFRTFYATAYGKTQRHPATALRQARLEIVKTLKKQGISNSAWFWGAFASQSGHL